MSSVETWYVLRDGVSIGPLTRATVEAMIRGGEVRPDTMVWPGAGEWIAAGISPLASAFAPAPVPAGPLGYPPPPPPSPMPMPSPPATGAKSSGKTWLLGIGVIAVIAIAANWKQVRDGFTEGYRSTRGDSTAPTPDCGPQGGPGCGANRGGEPGGQSASPGLLDRELNRMALRYRVEDLIKGRVPEGTDDETAKRMGAQFAMRGLGRLDPRMLAERADIISHVYRDLDERRCAAMARGQEDPGALTAVLARYDSTVQSHWAEIQISALVAELKAQDQVTRPPRDKVVGAFDAIAATLDSRDRDRFDAVRRSGGQGNDAELCWFGRTVTEGTLRVPEPARDEVLTTLALMNVAN